MHFFRYFFLLIFIGVSLTAQERITFFGSDIVVHENGKISVQETIEVISQAKQIVHGIVREFPTTYTYYGFLKYIVDFNLVSVTLDGNSIPYKIESVSNGKKLYIGDKQRLLPVGKHTYVISYQTNRQLGFFDNHDELYWNVTGNGWRFAIEKVQARVQLPKTIPLESIQTYGYTGYQGDQGKAYAQTTHDDAIVFSTTSTLDPYQGLTVAVGFAKGFILPASWQQKLYWFISDNGAVVLTGLTLVLLLIIFFCGLFSAYRQNRAGIVIPLFYPPEKMSSSSVGFMSAMKFKHLFLSADIVDLAVRGFITITYHTDGSYTLESVKSFAPSQELSAYDIKLLSALFDRSKSLMISKKYNTVIKDALKRCQDYDEDSTKPYMTFLDSFWHASIIVLVLFSVGIFFVATIQQALITIVALGFLVFVSKRFYCVYTLAGRKVQDMIDGFKLYLVTAEIKRMDITGTPPNKTPELYEKYLPYAIALGIEKQWTAQFATLFKHMATAGQAYQPIWYRGKRFKSDDFGSSLTQSFSQVISSASVPPGTSSGSSGSGRSGGGGGGGGGGGW